jgi:hypothetical protein
MRIRKLDPIPEPTHRPSRRGSADGARELTVTTLRRTSSGYVRRDEAVPFLRLSGRWLEQLGFARGCRVLVAAEQRKLVITVSEPATSAP